MLIIYLLYWFTYRKLESGAFTGVISLQNDGNYWFRLKNNQNQMNIVDMNNLSINFTGNFNIDRFYKDLYIKVCKKLSTNMETTSNIPVKQIIVEGFTYDESININNIDAFKSAHCLSSKLQDIDISNISDVYSFEWNESTKNHMLKCIFTDITNIFNILYTVGEFTIEIGVDPIKGKYIGGDFAECSYKNVGPKPRDHSEFHYHSCNITYHDKNSLCPYDPQGLKLDNTQYLNVYKKFCNEIGSTMLYYIKSNFGEDSILYFDESTNDFEILDFDEEKFYLNTQNCLYEKGNGNYKTSAASSYNFQDIGTILADHTNKDYK